MAQAGRAQTYGLPKTGQVAVYHYPSENDLGDDGATQAGYPLSGRRDLAFQNNGDGTVTDTATGLMWQKKDSGGEEFGGLYKMMTWEEAFEYVAKMNADKYAGYNDWRVPNVKELLSIANKETWLPAAYYIFDNMLSQPYWSSSSVKPGGTHNVFYIHFSDGFIQYMIPDSAHLAYVKAVRSYHTEQGVEGFPKTGQNQVYHDAGGYDLGDDGVTQSGYPYPSYADPFTEKSDGTVIQNAIGLIWQKKDSATQPFGNYSDTLTWEEAFAYVAEMNKEEFAGYDDWRVPNYFELTVLPDLGEFYPIIDPIFRDHTQTNFYWSGTTRYGVTSEAMIVSFSNGLSRIIDKTQSYYLRAVRGGAYVSPSPTPAYPTPTPDPASVRGLPKTGQMEIYHPAGENDPGDDGVTRVGYPLTGKRFEANSQTVTDYATGLIWQRAESSTQSFGGLYDQMTWEEAFQYVAAINADNGGAGYAGFNDWRVPNIKELYSIVDFGRWLPAINTYYFTGTAQDTGYWGSTVFADLLIGRRPYQVFFAEGVLQCINIDEPPEPTGYVRAVRSLVPESGNQGFPKTGQTIIVHYPSGHDLGDDGAIQAGYPASGTRFVDNGNGTVTDKATGLIWQKTDSAYLPVGSYSGSMNWEDTFNYIREMNIRHVSGYSTWRLPNIQELLSLLDFGQFDPNLNSIFKYCNQSGYHWSSTSRFWGTSDHWAANFVHGVIVFKDGTESHYVKGVLGGPGQSPGPTTTTPTPTPPGYHTPSPTHYYTPPQTTPTLPPYEHLYYGLPKTGQTTVYHQGDGNYDLGDDGVTQVGYPVAADRWENLGNGIVIDWAAGLMWQQSESHGQLFGGLTGVMSWKEAFQYVAVMNQSQFGGFSDWRLPNCLELLSLRDLGEEFTIPSAFINTTPDGYWSSTCSADFSVQTFAFMVWYYSGHMFSKNTEIFKGAVRACRTFYHGMSPCGFPKTGQTIVAHPAGGYDLGGDGAVQAGYPTVGPRFTDNGNGTVSDNATGLTWQQDCSVQPYSWNDAFAYVSDLNQQNFAGHSDWRLPNQMELFSLINYGECDPAIEESFFYGTQSGDYWSGNTGENHPTLAWYVSFNGGGGDQFQKTITLYVRAVRGDTIPGPRPTPTPQRFLLAGGDYNGDGTSDIAVFRRSSGLWAIRNLTRCYFGDGGDTPVSGDYDGNGTTEIGTYRPGSGLWAIRNLTRVYFGASSDLPIPGDYDGDGCCDVGIFREGSGLWAIRGVTRCYFGAERDRPVPGDYNGDGTRDIGIFRGVSGLWALRTISRFYFGSATDAVFPGDYDGNSTWEAGIFRSGTGLWAIRGATRSYFGNESDQPIPADFEGNLKDNLGIFRDYSGLWAIKGLTRIYYGQSGDIPVTR